MLCFGPGKPGPFLFENEPGKQFTFKQNSPGLFDPVMMKTTAKLKKFYLHQVDTIEAILRKSGHDFTAEDLHTLRVCIKKIKAVLSFLRFFDPDFNKDKYFKPYENLFRQAGEVREIQIQQALLRKYESNPLLAKYFEALSLDFSIHQAAFAKLIDRKLRKKIKTNAKKVEAFFPKAAQQLMTKYLLEEQASIHKLIKADQLAKKDVHDLRKQIKDIYYLQKIFQPKNKRLVIADDFQELLGQWHDLRVVAKDILKGAQNHKLQPDEIKALMALRKKILTSSDRQLAKIERTRKTV